MKPVSVHIEDLSLYQVKSRIKDRFNGHYVGQVEGNISLEIGFQTDDEVMYMTFLKTLGKIKETIK